MIIKTMGKDGKLSTEAINSWRQDFTDTYRHLREHGNSAFIFILELALAALSARLVTAPGHISDQCKLSLIGVLFAAWAMPSMFVHLLAQNLERRFSRYDQDYHWLQGR